MAKRILIVEDEPDLVAILEENLQRERYLTSRAMNGREALRLAARPPHPDLILLDLMLPELSGLEVCRELRKDEKTSAIPVLMLTARGEEIDRVVGFEMGADDYLTKPFSVRELLLRIKAILKRAAARTPEESARETLFGLLAIDHPARRVFCEGREVELTALEYNLLTTFLERRGRVQSREGLLDAVWGVSALVQTRTVDAHVKRLRKKLGAAGKYIKTLRGVGYRFQEKPPPPKEPQASGKKS